MQASASTGFPLLGAITVAVIAIVLLLVLIMITWRSRRPGWRQPGVPRESERTREIQEAAAEDVAEVRKDAKYFIDQHDENDDL